ncbi:acyl carrier protein [Vulgatibacter incomptus]|uniref:Acyl carrier protein n=1 Tax=Vulgatibacter incomptus TaxID=1391653 RepID=A0A0K1PDB6_9BACT|nr:acyl carrier protein [Vulgatibacter incomptus]AKU91396.1 Acyl carrier protein [Vulgatibacter incomptus]
MSPAEEEVLAEVRRIAAAELGWKTPIDPRHELVADLRLDSIGMLTVVQLLEDRFRIALAEGDEAEIRTVEELVRLVARRRAEADR